MVVNNEKIEWGKRTGLSVAVKFALTIIVVTVLVVAVCVACGHHFFTKTLEQEYNDTASRIADTAALAIDVDSLDRYVETGTVDAAWQETHDVLQILCDNMNCTFIYVTRLSDDQSTYDYIYEAVNSSSGFTEYPLGYKDETDDAGYLENYLSVLRGETPSVEYLFAYPNGSDEANTTAYKPLYRSDGTISAMLIVEMPMIHIVKERQALTFTMAAVSYAVAAVILVVLLIVLYKRMIMPIKRINAEARRFVEEQAVPSDELLDIRGKDEFGMLAKTMTKLEFATAEHIETLEKMTAERERVGTELEVATHIQANTLPLAFPQYPETLDYLLFATMNPAKEVGGDFYDFFKVDDDHLALVIADVSGKGVPAALFMMASKIEIKNHAMLGIGPAEALRRANENLCENNAADMFVTTWIGIYEISTHKLTCANAGHEYPAFCHAGQSFELYKDKRKLALGAFPGIVYKEYEIQLEVGDTLFVYTDGVAEATNVNFELFGTDKMLESLTAHKDEEPEAIVKALVDDVMEFTGEAEQFDDVTALCFRVMR